ncbi:MULTISPECIES: alpha/beta hydrolase family protein [Paenibacillus]|nr:alpha/beta fold hydrolase [Paenibacillus rhizosphaerae]
MWRKALGLVLATGLMAGGSLPNAMAASAGEQTMIPLRTAAEALGAKVLWDGTDKRVQVSLGKTRWKITPGSKQSLLDQAPYELARTAVTDGGGALLVPLQSFTGALGIRGTWADHRWSLDPDDWKGRAIYWMTLLRHGKWEEAGRMMDASLSDAYPPSSLPKYEERLEKLYGLDWSLLHAEAYTDSVRSNARLVYQTPKGETFGMELRFSPEGLLNDIAWIENVTSSYRAPAYDHPEKYTEEEVQVGQSPLLLPGTLTLPRNIQEKVPALVLVHGSGPNDRDESSGGGKLFRDLAVGLAGEGIAVLRYEKRTREYPLRSATPSFTVQEETVDDAVSAAALLAADPRIDPQQIYVLGHSQGGMLVPRIIASDTGKHIAGAVVMSAPSGPLEDLMLMQYRGILGRAEEEGASDEKLARLQKQVDTWEKAVALLKDPGYSKEHLPEHFPLPNAYWWFDFRNYSGPLLARDQNVPMYILQGENDVQVPPPSLKVWRSALSQRKDVVFKSYPGLNHMYIYYSKNSTGEEYKLPGNVPEEVITDVANWIHLGMKDLSKNGEEADPFVIE